MRYSSAVCQPSRSANNAVRDPIAALAGLTAPAGAGREWLSRLVGSEIELQPVRARSVSHLIWQGAPPVPPEQLPNDVTGGGDGAAGLDWYAWFLAAGITPAQFVPDVGSPDWSSGRVQLSRDWSALVLRDGISFVARSARISRDDFHAAARIYVRTLHLDVLILGVLQRTALRTIADSVAELGPDAVDAQAVEDLERRLLHFRMTLWWNDVARQGRQASQVLVALQRQHQLHELYERIVDDLTEISRYWRARRAAQEEAARLEHEEARDQEERRERRLSNAVAVVSFFFLPLTVVYTGSALIADPSWALFLWSTAIGLPPCLAALVFALRREKPRPPRISRR